jgi:hypothetical protein
MPAAKIVARLDAPAKENNTRGEEEKNCRKRQCLSRQLKVVFLDYFTILVKA